MNTAEVAQELETTPKELRRFLRADSTYRNVGSGGRYTFEDKDLPTLKKRFAAYQEKQASRSTVRRSRKITDQEGMPVDILRGQMTPEVRAERDRQSRARVDRLEAALKEKGLHISQMKASTDA